MIPERQAIRENEKYRAHFAFIKENNSRFNLMSNAEIEKGYEHFVERHVFDALHALDLGIEWTNKKFVDIGSGSGVPGITLAIALEEMHASCTLIEATRKKADFLGECIHALDLRNVTVINDRAENTGRNREHREYYDISVMRAVGFIDECLELSMPLISVSGYSLLYRGQMSREQEDLSTKVSNIFSGKLEKIVNYSIKAHTKDLCIVLFRKTKPISDEYPRREGIPRKRSQFKQIL